MSIQVQPEQFDKDYYRSINYQDYAEREPRYHQMAREIYAALSAVGMLNARSRILDFGCAFGFLVAGFRQLGLVCEGHDISVHAESQASQRGITFVHDGCFDLITCLDVLEHMEDRQINEMLESFHSNRLLVRIPCSTDGRQFHLEISRRDQTHINMRTKDQWREFMACFGYGIFLPLNLYSCYDSPGVLTGLFVRA